MAQISYRAARLEDAALAADLMTAGFPREPEDPILTRYRWEHPRGGWSIQRFIGSVDGSDIAYLSSAHSEWSKNPEHHGWLEVYFDQARKNRSALKEMWQWIEEQREGALILNASAAEEEIEAHEVLGELGYTLDRTDKVWSLDLRKHGPRLSADAAAARAKAKQAGIEFTTVAAFQHPDKLRLVHALNERTRQDIPTTVPVVPESFESWVARIDPPDRRRDRWWLAIDGDRPVAMSMLGFPPERGNVWTHYTACHPDYRGRGLARGIKLQTLAQAIELGVPFVRTDNDSENAAMLHINETLGYEPMPGFSTYQKRVSK